MAQISIREAINQAFDQEMERDPAVILMGEDIVGGTGSPGEEEAWGGAMGLYKGLYKKYGDRVLDTPLSEAAFVGAAVGAATCGMRPVAELMFIDFLGVCFDQIFNQAAKFRYMFGGKAETPVVIRTMYGAGLSAAAQHSQTLTSIFTHVPGIKVVCPSSPYDAKGLMIEAIRDDDPVIFCEHKKIYDFTGDVPEELYAIPFGEANIVREGDDCTIVSYGMMVHRAAEAAEQLGRRRDRVRGDRPAHAVSHRHRYRPRKRGEHRPTGRGGRGASALQHRRRRRRRGGARGVPGPEGSRRHGDGAAHPGAVLAGAGEALRALGREDRGLRAGHRRMIKAITMPKWGLSMTEGVVGDWLVAEGDAVESGTEVVLVDTEKIAGAVEAADASTLRRAVAVTGDTLPVGALLGVLAGDEIPDAEIDAFVRQFQENFVPEEAGAEDGGDQTETVQVGELSINYLRQGSADKTAVLLHGFGGDLDNWLFNHPALSSNRTVIAVDLPGHGRSTKEVGDGSFASMADVLHDTMRELDVAEADWVGHSMGGAVALHVARSQPQLVRSLTLIASAGLGPEINTEYLQGFTRSRSRRELKPHVQQLFGDASLVTRQLVEDLLKYKRLDGVQECLEALADRLADAGDQAEDARRIIDAVPTLVIWGADDRIIPASHARDLPNQDRVHILENTGHMVQMERASEVNRLITAFWNDQG